MPHPPQPNTPHLTNRRQAISTLSLTTATLYLTSLTSPAAGIWGKTSTLPLVKIPSAASKPSQQIGGFPDEWTRLQGKNLATYATFINSLKLKNITAQEVISAHAKQRGRVWNSLPPQQWWKRMGNTLRVVDRISSEMNIPVKEIVSAYRCPIYNSRCPGARSGSYHQANVAIDVKFDTSARNVTKTARSLRDRGLFKGGVGGYYSFTHIDTRGENVNW